VKQRNRGDKRRAAKIRWKRQEIVHIILLALTMIFFSVLLALWIDKHPFQ